ncbi:hypothetical protein OROHE_006123 [Orobanche hederae]
MSGGSRYEIHRLKVVLHALKHRTSTVNGVILDRSPPMAPPLRSPTPSLSSTPRSASFLPRDCPNYIEEYYGEKGLSIVGYFHANERYDDFELPSVAMMIST